MLATVLTGIAEFEREAGGRETVALVRARFGLRAPR